MEQDWPAMTYVYVNGVKREYTSEVVSYARAVELAGLPYRPDYTVTTHGRWPDGDMYAASLCPGEGVSIGEGARINVAHTGRG